MEILPYGLIRVFVEPGNVGDRGKEGELSFLETIYQGALEPPGVREYDAQNRGLAAVERRRLGSR